MAHINVAIAERAGQQLGLLRRSDLHDLHVSQSQVRTCIAGGLLIRVGRGVLRYAGFEQSHRQKLLIAAWVAGDGAAVSHRAAASLWGFDGTRPGSVEVSVQRPRNPRNVPADVHRVRDLRAVDITQRGLIPTTSPARTLLDIAGDIGSGELEEALDGACRRGQVYLPHLRWRLAELRHKGRPGVAALDALLSGERRPHLAESWLESTLLRLLRDAGLPAPRIQVVVKNGPGGKRYRLDAFYDDHCLVIEVDGHATHATRRQRQADAERDARLLAAGLRVLRFTHEDLVERPDYVGSMIARFLRMADPVR